MTPEKPVKDHPTFRKRLNGYALICLSIAALCWGVALYSELNDFDPLFRNIPFIASAVVAGSVFPYGAYLWLTVACPDCHCRLKLIDHGYREVGARARCPRCGQVYDLGMSFGGPD
jgi:hypothetical protein